MPGSQNGRLGNLKHETIHGLAQSGDLIALQIKLQDDPSLINQRNSILLQTPLHVAAGSNNVEIVKFLLEWKGAEKIELEAKNMYGETPLHMAAKNGCSESAHLLIIGGASLEARTNNGMTPLHLAVWHALLAGDRVTVGTLLEFSADCSAKDEEGKTPLDHVSHHNSTSGEKLRETLTRYMQEQRKRKAIELFGEAKERMEEFEVAMSRIVGLKELKLQLHKWAKGMLFDEKRRALGLNIATRKPPHMAFLGNPGTGKTMVARALGKLLHLVGILPTDRVTEVQRTDLVGEFVGHTGPKTRRKIKEAEGGILFIDEAYRLIPMQKSDDKDYGIEALEEIMSVMDSGKVVVIFAGYREPMQRVIASNEGFSRRVTKFFYFEDFNTNELSQILHLKMKDQEETSPLYGFKLHMSCTVKAIAELIKRETSEKQRKEMNGGLIDPLLSNARENLDLRLDFDCFDADSLVTITLEDLEAGLRSLVQH